MSQIVTAGHREVKFCTDRHTGEVFGDQKLGHPDLIYWVLGHRRKCLYLHNLCKQLTCGHHICNVGATGRDATPAWDLTYC